MKRSLLALAALTAFAGAASAQSSVTVFGIVDLAARNQNNGNGSINSLSSAGINTSRLGFRGIEDLGGGLRAGFWLEGQLDPDTGNAGGQTWQRRSTVSLIGGFGEVRLGRDYKPTFWNTTTFDPFGTNGVGNQNNVITGAQANLGVPAAGFNFTRADNTIGYFLPSMGGLYGQVQVSAPEGYTQKYVGGRIGYAAGPLNVAIAYGKNDKVMTMVDDFTVLNAGASYDLGVVLLAALYSKHEYGALDLQSYMVAATVPMGAGKFKFSYNESEIRTSATAKPKAKQFAVGYQYDLSKRTAIYTQYAELKNDTGLAQVTSSSGRAPTTTGFKSKGYELGIRHSF